MSRREPISQADASAASRRPRESGISSLVQSREHGVSTRHVFFQCLFKFLRFHKTRIDGSRTSDAAVDRQPNRIQVPGSQRFPDGLLIDQQGMAIVRSDELFDQGTSR
jgi:hypothetical protein